MARTQHRIEQLMQNYETIADTKLPFVKLLDVGEKIIVNNVAGYLHSRIVYYLMNLHIQPRKIYFARVNVINNRPLFHNVINGKL